MRIAVRIDHVDSADTADSTRPLGLPDQDRKSMGDGLIEPANLRRASQVVLEPN